MTDPGGVLLDRGQLERAFTALGDRLVRRGVVADVFIVGGAAMALAYDAGAVQPCLGQLSDDSPAARCRVDRGNWADEGD